jgi:hypothetical protein
MRKKERKKERQDYGPIWAWQDLNPAPLCLWLGFVFWENYQKRRLNKSINYILTRLLKSGSCLLLKSKRSINWLTPDRLVVHPISIKLSN